MTDGKNVDVEALRELADKCREVADTDDIITCHYLTGNYDTDCKICRFNDKERCLPKVFADLSKRIRKALGETVEYVLAADGLPIVVGEAVYYREGTPHAGKKRIVKKMELTSEGYVRVWFEGGFCASQSMLTHTPPDTQERIDEDARKNYKEYWGCSNEKCNGVSCPAFAEDITPYERYDTDLCINAQNLDLLRRQRELDARLMGGDQ